MPPSFEQGQPDLLKHQGNLEPEDLFPLGTLEPKDFQPFASLDPEELFPRTGFDPADVQPFGSLEPEDLSPFAGLEPDDLHPLGGLNPEELLPLSHLEPEDLHPLAGLDSEDLFPFADLEPEDFHPLGDFEPEEIFPLYEMDSVDFYPFIGPVRDQSDIYTNLRGHEFNSSYPAVFSPDNVYRRHDYSSFSTLDWFNLSTIAAPIVQDRLLAKTGLEEINPDGREMLTKLIVAGLYFQWTGNVAGTAAITMFTFFVLSSLMDK
jgi:hypothetical protein